MTYKYYFEKFKKNIFFVHFYINNKNNIYKTLLVKFSSIPTDEINICKEYENNNFVMKSEYKNLFEKIIYYKIFRNFNILSDLPIEIVLDNKMNLSKDNQYKELCSEEKCYIENNKTIINDNNNVDNNNVDIINNNNNLDNNVDNNNVDIINDNNNVDNNIFPIKFKINIEYLINNNIIKYNIIDKNDNSNISLRSLLCRENKKDIIDELIIIIEEYNDYKITLSEYLCSLSIFENKMDIINNCMDKLFILHNKLNMIHGDCKLNNILYSTLNLDNIMNLSKCREYKELFFETLVKENISFIDLEFSIFFKENVNKINKLEKSTMNLLKNNEDKEIFNIKFFPKKYIMVNEILINNYLILDDNFIITQDFLKLFDIFLFTLSFFILNKIDENHYLKHKMEDKIYKNLFKKYVYSDYFILFFITFINIYNYFSINKIYSYETEIIFYKACYFKNILKIYSLEVNSFEDYDIINNNLKYINDIFNEIKEINN